jgi:S1-C subfamily serine protease
MEKVSLILSLLISILYFSSHSLASQELRVQTVDCLQGTYSDELNIVTNEKTYVINICSSNSISESSNDKNAINYFINMCPIDFTEVSNGNLKITYEGKEMSLKACGNANSNILKKHLYSKNRISFYNLPEDQMFPSCPKDYRRIFTTHITDLCVLINSKKVALEIKKEKEKENKKNASTPKLFVIGTGTGFFVSSEGHAISNNHVVGICRKIVAKVDGKFRQFKVLNTDTVNDLGLIKVNYNTTNYLNINSIGAELGEDIVTFGFPLSGSLGSNVKLNKGIVSSLSGPGNNYSEIQIDAAIQPGNSGGPVLNMEGQVIGVASSGLNKIKMMEKQKYIPENVNFAIASSVVANFLKGNDVGFGNMSFNIKNTKELAKIGKPATIQLICLNTKAQLEILRKKKKHINILLNDAVELKVDLN